MEAVLGPCTAFFADSVSGSTRSTTIVELFNLYATFFVYLAIIFPLIGGSVLWMGFQMAKVPGFTFVKCWKIYLAGLCYGYLVIFGVRLIVDPGPVVPTVLFFAVPLIAIPLLTRNFAQRILAVEIPVILLANAIMVGLAAYTLAYVIGPGRAANREQTITHGTVRSSPP
jgi:hypothetical protein